MADSPLLIVLEMIGLLIDNTMSTFTGIIGLFNELLGSLGIVTETGGLIGFGLSIILVGLVGFFIAKLIFGGAMKLVALIAAGLVIAYIILLSALI